MDLNRITLGQIDQVIGEKTTFYPVHAEVKPIAIGCGSNGVGSGLRLAITVHRHGRNELARCEIEMLHILESKLKVVALSGFGDTSFLDQAGGICWTLQNEVLAYQ